MDPDSELPAIHDRLQALGLGGLGEDAGADQWRLPLRKWANTLEGDTLRREAEKVEVMKRLQAAGVQAYAKVVNAALDAARANGTEEVVQSGPDPAVTWEHGQAVLRERDQLARFRRELSRLGYAGDTSPAELLLVAFTSRLLERPINVCVEGPSAGGKTFTVEAVQQFVPPESVHDLTASSERALAYSEFDTEHAYVIVSEASALYRRESVGATIIRELAWGNRIRYETVESTDDGIEARTIEKPGPTGLITTTTTKLEPELSTRMLRIQIPDHPDQTAKILESLAEEAEGGAAPAAEFPDWVAAQRWLAAAGERRVVVPFARAIQQRVPTDDVRLRRDFRQILGVVRAHALLHQVYREEDSAGRVIAEITDYQAAYRLLADVLAVTLDDVTEETRETVAAVAALEDDNPSGVTYGHLQDELGLSKSGISRRVSKAEPYLYNAEERKGRAARIKVGEPLPDRRPVLPDPEEVARAAPPSEDPPVFDATAQEVELTVGPSTG